MKTTLYLALVFSLVCLSVSDLLTEVYRVIELSGKERNGLPEYHVENANCPDPQAIEYACKLLKLNDQEKITLWDRHPSGVKDNATALDNIRDACNGKAASRSKYTCKECPTPGAPGGEVCLQPILLRYMVDLFPKIGYFHVNEIAGACHSCKSKHYLGRAVDIDPTKSYTSAKTMLDLCENMGGKALNETNHIHCQFNP